MVQSRRVTSLAVKTSSPPPGLEPGSSDCRSGALPTKLQSETSFHRLCCAFIVSVSLHYNLIKHASSSLIKPLTLIVNQVLHTGIFPRQLKLSRSSQYIKVANKPVAAIIDQFLCYRQCLKYLCMLYLIN